MSCYHAYGEATATDTLIGQPPICYAYLPTGQPGADVPVYAGKLLQLGYEEYRDELIQIGVMRFDPMRHRYAWLPNDLGYSEPQLRWLHLIIVTLNRNWLPPNSK